MATFLKDDQNILVRDQNRFRKIYRYIRKKPRPLQCEGSDISHFVWGTYFVEFKDQSEVEHFFPCCYETAPTVVATTVAKGTASGGTLTKAQVSYMTYGESTTGLTSNDTIVGPFGNDAATKRANLEREYIDLKNTDDSIYRVRFSDGDDSSDNFNHAYKPGYSPSLEVVVDLSDVSHYGTGTVTSGGNPAQVIFGFKNQAQNEGYYSGTTLDYNTAGKDDISVYLGNLWWDFSNSDGTVWRLKVAGGGNYPEAHSSAPSRSVTKTFDVTVATSATLGDWIANFITAVDSTTVDGEKFSDKWNVTLQQSGNGSGPNAANSDNNADLAQIKFEAKTGNKGNLAALDNPPRTNVDFYDSFVRARVNSEPDSIAFQVSANDGSETETTTKGLLTKIIETVNGNGTFSSKWSASVSSNSVERVDSSGYFETFILTFTAQSGNLGPISNITDPGSGQNPGTFYYGLNHYLEVNGGNLNPGVELFRLHTTNLYRKERYPDQGQDPDPLPIVTENGAVSGAAGQPTVPSNPNFNVFVTDITSQKCTFRTSGYFTGYVYYQALVDGAYTMPNIGKSLEVKTLQFDGNNDFIIYNFTATFKCEPIVTVTADKDVNAFVTAISKTSVTVEVSKAGYQGKVYLQAIEKGC